MPSFKIHTHTVLTTTYISLTVFDALPIILKDIPTPWTGKDCEEGVVYLLSNAKLVQLFTGEKLQIDQPSLDRHRISDKLEPLIWVNRVTLLPAECIQIEIEASFLEKGIPSQIPSRKLTRKEQEIITKYQRAGVQLFQKRKHCSGCM